MTDGVTITVRNKDRLLSKLKMLAPMVQEELEKAGQKSAEEMQSFARQFAPIRSGRLRASIVVTPPGGLPPSHSQGGVNGMPVPDGAWMVAAGNARVRYAHLVEYGTAPHVAGGRFAGAVHPGARRQPFFWPSYRLVRRRHKGRVTRAIRKAVKQVASR